MKTLLIILLILLIVVVAFGLLRGRGRP